MDKPLSIVVPIHSFEPGGVERVGLNLARYWQDAGHDVTIVLGRDEGLDRKQAPALRYLTRRSIIPTAAFETLWMIWCMMRYLRRKQPDVIFCAGNTYAVVCLAMRLFFGRNCPPIVTKISNDLVRQDQPRPFRMAYRLWLRIQGRYFDRIVGMAAPMRQEIASFMNVEDERIAIVPDPSLSRERLNKLLAIPRPLCRAAAVRFIAIGRLAPQKNFAMLLKAFALGSRPEDTLTIVGDGPQKRSLYALASRLGLLGQVTFTGHVPSPDVMLERSDCLLMSSTYEGVPAVVIEAIAAGLPVISTDCSLSMPELLGAGERGVLVPVGEVDALARKITATPTLPRMTTARRRYAARYVLEEASERYLSVMRSAIAQKSGRRIVPLAELHGDHALSESARNKVA